MSLSCCIRQPGLRSYGTIVSVIAEQLPRLIHTV